MASYLLIQSRSPWEAGDGARHVAWLARDLDAAGHDVTLWLVQNGVLAARAAAEDRAGLASLGRVRVLADDFALRERGIQVEAMRQGIEPCSIDQVVAMLASGFKALWS
jgi:hypothetical protein